LQIFFRDQVTIGDRPEADREVDLSIFEIQRPRPADDLQQYFGMVLSQSRKIPRDDFHETRWRCEPHASSLRSCNLADCNDRSLQLRNEGRDPCAERRQPQAIRSAKKDGCAEGPLQRGKAAADRGVLDAHRARGAGERV